MGPLQIQMCHASTVNTQLVIVFSWVARNLGLQGQKQVPVVISDHQLGTETHVLVSISLVKVTP